MTAILVSSGAEEFKTWTPVVVPKVFCSFLQWLSPLTAQEDAVEKAGGIILQIAVPGLQCDS